MTAESLPSPDPTSPTKGRTVIPGLADAAAGARARVHLGLSTDEPHDGASPPEKPRSGVTTLEFAETVAAPVSSRHELAKTGGDGDEAPAGRLLDLRTRRGTKQWRKSDRDIALALLARGIGVYDVAQALGVSRHEIMSWADSAGRKVDLSAAQRAEREANEGLTAADAHQIERMAAYGIPKREIAVCFGLTTRQLERTFGRRMEMAAARVNARVAGHLFSAVKGGSVTAAKFWLERRAGWNEKTEVAVTSTTGVLVAPGAVTPTEWIAQSASGPGVIGGEKVIAAAPVSVRDADAPVGEVVAEAAPEAAVDTDALLDELFG